MLQSSGKLRKSIRVEPSIYQAWVPPFFFKPNQEDEIEISFKKCECVYEPTIVKDENSIKKTDEALKNLKFLLRSMETDFNYLSGEKIMEHMSKNCFLGSQNFYAEKLLLTRDDDQNKVNTSPKINDMRIYSNRSLGSDASWSMRRYNNSANMQTGSMTEKPELSRRPTEHRLSLDSNPVSYGKLWEATINQQLFINIIDSWRKSVGYIFNESYKSSKYTLDEGIEILQEGIALSKKVMLPELEIISNSVEESVQFEEKAKKLLGAETNSETELGSLETSRRVPITELYELLKEGENCVFRSNYLDFLRHQLEKLKSWRSNVQSAIIEKNLDKCKDSIKDKDEIIIEVPGINDLTEQIAASNWIEKVERSLCRPMKLNFAENLLNEPAANFLDENNVTVKQQLINRVRRAQEWLSIVLSPPFVYHLVAACKVAAPNDIPDYTQKVIDEAKSYMEKSTEWKLPRPDEFEKICLESSSLKIIIPLMKYMEPVYLRWRKWNKKYKRLMDGLCIYMEAQLILEEAEYTLCDYLDLSEYLPELKRKIDESSSWLHESKEFLKNVSDFHTRQDISNVSSSIWNTIASIKKGSEPSKLKIQQILDLMNSQFQERLSFEELKRLIEIGNELTIYEITILQELTSCQDSCEKWCKKAKEYLKCSKSTGINILTVINLLLERSCVLISKETEDSLFAEVNFILWKMDINEIQAPINDFELISLNKRLGEIKLFMDLTVHNVVDTQIRNQHQSKGSTNPSPPDINKQESNSQNEEFTVNISSISESNISQPEAIYESNSTETCIEELNISQINISHWGKLKELESIAFITKLQDVFIYWTELINRLETEKKEIDTWCNILEDLKHLPILFNDLESKINKMIDEYNKILLILKCGDEETNKLIKMEHPLSLLHSYQKLNELNDKISNIPIIIKEWDKWKMHLDDLNNCDLLSISKFPYLRDPESCIFNVDENIVQIEKIEVTSHLQKVNENLSLKSQWGISDFKNILADLKHTGRLMRDLSTCEEWVKDVQGISSNQSMEIEYWNELLRKGKVIRIIDNQILKEFEGQVRESMEWMEIYNMVISSDIFSKVTKQKRNNKSSAIKIHYNIAELLVATDYGLGERLITFRDLKHYVKSFIELRDSGIKCLNISIIDRRENALSKLLNKVLCQETNINNIDSETLDQIYASTQITASLRNILEELTKHPIFMDFINFIQDEILIREINEKMLNTLITDVNPYFSTPYSDSKINCLSKISTYTEASDLINYIIDHNMNTMPKALSKENEKKCISLDEICKSPLTIEDLKVTVSRPELFATGDFIITEIFIENKYIDLNLFEKFKIIVSLSSEWLKIFNTIYFSNTTQFKTEIFYNKEISINIISDKIKHSIDNLIREYISTEIDGSSFNSTLHDGDQFRFDLDWNKILGDYNKQSILCDSNHIYNNTVKKINKAFQRIKCFDSESTSNLEDIPCKNEEFNFEASEYNNNYNLPFYVNLLHHLRNNKDIILSQTNGKKYYEYVLNSVRLFIKSKYFKHFSEDEGFNFEQFEVCINIYNDFIKPMNLELKENIIHDTIKPLVQDTKFKRNKRFKSQMSGEMVNEDNIDGIINLIRSFEMPTMELSLFLISCGRQYVKFELKEFSDLCTMVEFSLLWMSLTVKKFPSIYSKLNDYSTPINNSDLYIQQTITRNMELWERDIYFNIYDSENNLIENLSTDEIINSTSVNHIQNTLNLKEFIYIIEICDQLPIQIPMKSRLVQILIATLKWVISAREAILLLPKNTILYPWTHIEGIVKEVKSGVKDCKILKAINLDQESYRVNECEVMHILSTLSNHEQDHGVNFDKNEDVNIQLNKKLPRPRGRPKREQTEIMKSDSQYDDAYSYICADYKEIDQSSNSIFPKSFYFWLSKNDQAKNFSINELLSILPNEENQKANKIVSSSKTKDLNFESHNDYYYWDGSFETCLKEQIDEDIENKSKAPYIGLINPKYYPKKDLYSNKLLIDYILCMDIYNSIQNNSTELCSFCSNLKKLKKSHNNSSSSYVRMISCNECNRHYHQDCVGYSSKSNNFHYRASNNSTVSEFSLWVCPLCNMRSADSANNLTQVIHILRNSYNLEICHKNNAYVLSNTNIISVDGSENTPRREIPSFEYLRHIMKTSFSGSFSFIKLHERNVIANKFYLYNVWASDFYRVLKWDQFEHSNFNSSVFIEPPNIHDSILENSISSEKADLKEAKVIDMENETEAEYDQLTNNSDSAHTSRKGRLLKNKFSAKEMLNPKLTSSKPKKGRKRRISFPNTIITKHIRRGYPISQKNSYKTLQVSFERIFGDIAEEYLCSIDAEYIGRNKVIDESSKPLEIYDILILYIMGILMGMDEIVEIEWLYCILNYLLYFNFKFCKYNENCEILKKFQLSEDLSFINTINNQKRLSWEELQYILINFSPNFPIKLHSNKIFYSNLSKVTSIQSQCISTINYIKISQENYNKFQGSDQGIFTDANSFKKNGKSFKMEMESLLVSIIKSGIIIPEECVISHLLFTYYLESIVLIYGKQISNAYCNQLSPKPLYSTLMGINQYILFWKESDTSLTKIYNNRLIPPEYSCFVLDEDNNVDFQNPDKHMSRFQRFIKCCEIIQDSINQCNEWNERYKFLTEAPNEFEVYVEHLKQGLNLPCIYPPVYSFGNILASIESYEDFVNQVLDIPSNESSPTKATNPPGDLDQTQTINTTMGSCQPSPYPKFENIQILKNIREFLRSLPIQKNDLILKIDQMEENTKHFMESIKKKIPQLKQLSSAEALISQLQLIKEEAINKVPIIVNNVPEIRDMLNNIPDFGLPHHNLLFRTQFLMSLQCPIAKLRKPLNPFPNIPETYSNLSKITEQSNTNEPVQTELSGELNDTLEVISNRSILNSAGGTNIKFNTSCQLPNNIPFIWQNFVQQGNNPMSHYYYK
ncbi:AT hook and a PHD finger domain-containing chromatin protein [Cryptosporidium canis]|nr:AT hook and a PHD finger domain-containing chromatin protein [Cryptosporidium canis]